MSATLPYGTWPSSITGADLAAAGDHFGDLATTSSEVVFTRTDPDTGGMALHRWTPTEGLDALAIGVDVRSRVHEYGGGAIMVGEDTIVVVDHAEQRLWRVDGDDVAAITPPTDARVRFAAGVFVDSDTLVVVRETHDRSGTAAGVVNELVAVDLRDGSQAVLVDDHDFVGDPAAGSGGWIAWSTWDHPHMPWDQADLWVGRVSGSGADAILGVVGHVDGGDGVSMADWTWVGDQLWHAADASGYWELHRTDVLDGRSSQQITAAGIDLGFPRWQHGVHSLAAVGDTVVSAGVGAGHARLGRLVDSTWRPMTGDDVVVSHVVAMGDLVVTEEREGDGTQAIRRRRVDGTLVDVIDVIPSLLTRPGDVPTIEPVTVAVDGDSTHAFLHLPANADARGPADAAPPLLVFVHGGPTSNVWPVTDAGIAFWTTRGFAVANLNYRGSTGFGRDYRRLMRGRWGEIEVDDAIAVASQLAADGVVDGRRLAIRGGSAGGFTALAAVTRPEHPFACATSFFGVSDLAALAEHTHKFESRYLDSMVGRLPEEHAVYTERSPLTNVDHLTVPLLVLQGLEDRVVPPEQARAMVDAAAARGVPHAHIEFEGEGHGFRKPENITTWLQSELAFYGEVMGFDPAGEVPRVLAGQVTGPA